MYREQIDRPAVAMVELIFSIVVIGITLMSAPMLMQQASKSGFVAIQQEGINEAASRISMIMDHHWDETNTDDSILDMVLLTNTSVAELNESTIGGIKTGWRLGTPLESYRNFRDPDGFNRSPTAPSDLGPDDPEVGAGDEDDVDDFGITSLVQVEVSSADYVEKGGNITIATTVNYMSDAPTTGGYSDASFTFNPNFDQVINNTTNIKRITVRLTSSSGVAELDKNITLNAFSCNIGAYQLESRVF